MLPVETIQSVFPPSAEIRGVRYAAGFIPVRVSVRLRPITLLHATAMEAFGVSLDAQEIPAEQAMLAAWILSLDVEQVRDAIAHDSTRDFLRWTERITEAPGEIVRIVNAVVNVAFSTCVPGKRADGPNITNLQGPGGYGWPLETASALAAEFGMTVDQALETPIVRAFGLLACARIRNGGEAGGPDYYERIVCREIHERKERERQEARERAQEAPEGSGPQDQAEDERTPEEAPEARDDAGRKETGDGEE